jgi:hypothetical protein
MPKPAAGRQMSRMNAAKPRPHDHGTPMSRRRTAIPTLVKTIATSAEIMVRE